MRYMIVVLAGLGLAASPCVAQPAAPAHAVRVLANGAQLAEVAARASSIHARALVMSAPFAEVAARASFSHAPAFARSARFAEAASGVPELRTRPPASWAPQDPADSLWRAARAALNQGEHMRAAALYRQIRTDSRFTGSAYRAAAYYWEAFARHRTGRMSELQNALNVLETLKRDHPRYDGMAEANRLETTIQGQLAQRGDEPAGRNLVAAGESQQCDEQLMVVEALMHLPAEQAVPILKRLMARRDCDKLRERAVFLLSQHRSGETEDMLLDAVRNDPSPTVREQAVFWLSQVNTDKALGALESIIRTATDRKLLDAALFAISQHRGERANSLLRDLARRSDTPADIRANAVFWLGQRGDPESGAFLRSLYDQVSGDEIKDRILFAVSQRRDEANGDWLIGIALNERESEHIRKQALFWASQHGIVSAARLAELYQRATDREIRKAVIFGLSQNRSQEAGTALMDIVRSERDTELRKDAVFWLSQRARTDPRVAQFLAELIGG